MSNPTETPTPERILLDAAKLITERGWRQSEQAAESGALTIVDAARLATAHAVGITDVTVADLKRHDVWPKEIHAALLDVFERALNWVHYAYMTGPVHTWADEPGRTQAEILDALRGFRLWRDEDPQELPVLVWTGAARGSLRLATYVAPFLLDDLGRRELTTFGSLR